MILLSNIGQFITSISLVTLIVVLIGFFLKKLKQPYIIGYIIAGILLGKSGFGFIEDTALIENLGELGIILLLFFVGMEISIPEFKKQWKIALFGTILQIILSVILMLIIGHFQHWQFPRSVILGFVISLSSTAIIIKLLQDKGIMDSNLGKNVLSILIMQDVLLAPMIIIISLFGGETQNIESYIWMIIGTLAIVGILIVINRKKELNLPYSKQLKNDHEIQVFGALFLCFGGALASFLCGLSAGLGAFVGGMVMRAGKTTSWMHSTLNSFRIIFVSLFFISIGLQIDLQFIVDNSFTLSIILAVVYITNHFLNTIILRYFSKNWQEAFVGGALLAQIGEMSFLLCSIAYSMSIIGSFSYKFTISLISITLIISPFWITASEKIAVMFASKQPKI